MSILSRFVRAPSIRPMLNIGCLFDISTGTYVKGANGESILNGGLSYITGIGGRGNTYKSTMAHFMNLRCLDRYLQADGMIYDTEGSLPMTRIDSLSKDMPNINPELENRLVITDKVGMSGNKWFEAYRDILKDRRANSKKIELTTPFVTRDGTPMKAMNPFIAELDSLSMMNIEAIDAMYDKNSLGESGLNMEAMRAAAAKSQMIIQLPELTGAGGSYLIMTAHVGDKHQIDPYAPIPKRLTFLKGKIEFKRVPENFTFLTNNLWYCSSCSVLMNAANKTPEFPRNKEDDLKGDTDLMIVEIQNLRAKSGPTGLPISIIISQSEGVHVGLTEFYYIKTNNKYGIGGNDRNYFLELTPDISMQRTTVRGKIDENKDVQRALEITSELCQMFNLWHHLPVGLLVTPKELYENLLVKGYDWARLLNTRGYWMFEEDIKKNKGTLPYLSTMDLLHMNAGIYHPAWYGELNTVNTATKPIVSKPNPIEETVAVEEVEEHIEELEIEVEEAVSEVVTIEENETKEVVDSDFDDFDF